VTFYYDPTIDHHHLLPVGQAGLFPAYFLAPQKPTEARALFDACLAHAGLLPPGGRIELPGPQRTPMMIHLAREWGLDDLAGRLQETADAVYEPTWDPERGELTWGFQLGEEHPRGQFNAAMAAAEVMSEGAWWRLFNIGPGSRFQEPTVAGIDFPDLTVTQAWWDNDAERLLVTTAPKSSRVAGRPTSFTVLNLPEASAWRLQRDDDPPMVVHPADGSLAVATTIDSHRFALDQAP
jgi:hypothetical protein